MGVMQKAMHESTGTRVEVVSSEVSEPSVNYYKRLWKKDSVFASSGDLSVEGSVEITDIILFTAREVDTQVKVLSESIRGSVYVVSPGKCYRKLSEQRYEINTVRLEDYVSLLDDLKDAVKGTTGIIHNWTSDVVDLEKQLELGIY